MRSSSCRAVHLPCPRCAENPVVKVYENRTMAVLFCEVCEHSWVVRPDEIPSGFVTGSAIRAVTQ